MPRDFGSPTYNGSISAKLKQFFEDANKPAWAELKWRNKIAAGFTNSGAHSGDKLNMLMSMALFAAQHAMVWVGLDTDTRAEIEALSMRSSIENGDDAWEGNLLGAYHRLSKAHKRAKDGSSINPDWGARHNHFHTMLVGACTNTVLLQLRAQLYDRADLYRKLSTRYLKEPRDDLGENEALLSAVLARDCFRAEALLKTHIRRTAQIILAEGTFHAS